MEETSRQKPWLLFGLIVFLLLEIAVQFAVRLDYGPDEPEHMEYAYSMGVLHHLPAVSDTHLVQHPPIYYAVMGALWDLAGGDQRPSSITAGPHALDAMTPKSIFARRVLRFASSILAALTLLVLARILLVMGAPWRWQAALVALVAAGPMFEYIGGVVNNENLSILYSSLIALALIVRLKRGTCSLRDAALLGLLVGGGLWVKQTTLFALPLALWVLWTVGDKSRRLARIGLFALAGLAIGIWWPLHNYLVAGSWFPCYTIPADQAEQAAYALSHPLALLSWLWNILKTNFLPDWSEYFLPGTISSLAALVELALIIGLFAIGLKDPDKERRQWRAMAFTGLVLLMIGVLQYCLRDDFRAQIGGRYLLNGIPWLVVLLGASLPKRLADGAENPKATQPPTWVTGVLSLLFLFDIAWWYLVFVFYAATGKTG